MKIETVVSIKAMTKVNCNTQRMSVVTSSLMGIIFGSAIIYLITRIVSVNRRVMFLEKHIVNKPDDDVVQALSSRIDSIQTFTQNTLSSLASGIGEVINEEEVVASVVVPTVQPNPVVMPVCTVVADASPVRVPQPVSDVKVVEELPEPDQNTSLSGEKQVVEALPEPDQNTTFTVSKVYPILDVDDDVVHLNIKVEGE
jgi:hypothetical protein